MSDVNASAESFPDSELASALAAIEDRAETVRDEQVERAVAALDARGDLTPAKRAAVERVATRLTARLTAPTERELRRASARGDGDAVRVALALFRES